jgi:hypothetical protein
MWSRVRFAIPYSNTKIQRAGRPLRLVLFLGSYIRMPLDAFRPDALMTDVLVEGRALVAVGYGSLARVFH